MAAYRALAVRVAAAGQVAAQQDGRFTKAFFRVAGLIDPPQALMRPGLMISVLRTARRVKAKPQSRPAVEALSRSRA